MSETICLTAAQAMVKWLSVQMTEEGERFIEGVWAIFGHGNVAGIGEALHGIGEALPTWRGQNEQTMAAIACAKTMRRKKAMAVTSSIGPGATNMVTARGWHYARRAPGALAVRQRRLPHGIRLFLYGLRDRRRDGNQDGGAPEGGDLLRRRWVLHDGELRTRHRRHAAHTLYGRADGQPGIRLYQPPSNQTWRR